MIHSRPGDDDRLSLRPRRSDAAARDERGCNPAARPSDCRTCPFAADCATAGGLSA